MVHTGHMARSPRHTSAGIVRTDASLSLSLSGMKHLTSAPWAALALGLVFASFHLACLAEARNSDNTTLTTHHPDPGSLEQCPSKLLLAADLTPELAPDVDFCPQAARCCHTGVDEYGWIAAAVGWSLWFLTLILLCVDKLMKLTPDEPKDLQA
ncbi:hypothetical protein GH733_013543 [Mirounga leonina]|nr:hypothetical protein GH733_013543 [Mirounga leonina]